MSTKTFFKRMALLVIGALGIGFLPATSSQAAIQAPTLALSSSTATAGVGDTASVTITHTFSHTLNAVESNTVRYTCVAPSGFACPALKGFQSASADTANVIVNDLGVQGYIDMSAANYRSGTGPVGWTDSSTNVATGSVRSVFTAKAERFVGAGVYTYTFYTQAGDLGLASAVSSTSVTWTVTVTAPDTAGAALSRFYLSNDMYTAKTNRNNLAPSSESSIVTSAGTAATPVAVGYAFITTANGAGDTRVAVGSTWRTVDESITVTVSGPGTVSNNDAPSAANRLKVTTLNSVGGNAGLQATESLTIFSDGTAGTSTITFTNRGGVTLKTVTVIFTGAPASAGIAFSDTYTSIGQSLNLLAQVKDTGGNILTSGTLYVFSSDTKVVSGGASLYSNAATQYQTIGRCSSTWDATAKTLSCALTTGDTGTASVYLADSWNVTASSFVTTPITLTVTGNTVASATVAFDKAVYVPGERAVITITTKDAAGRPHALNATGTLGSVTSNYTLTGVTALPFRGTSTSASDITYSSTLTEYFDTGVETRVVVMPTFGADITYTIKVPGFGVGVAATDVTATAKVVDPAGAARDKAIADAQAAADAATDAALQAIDAANAATDAANLSAEAADAATVAAEEAKDAADAATAAVEALATQVATLMAALQAQIRSLANTVAKIAKKVKA